VGLGALGGVAPGNGREVFAAPVVRAGAASRRAADRAAEAGADTCGDLGGVYRLHAGGGTRPAARGG